VAVSSGLRRKDGRMIGRAQNLAQFRIFVLDVLFLLAECLLWPVSDICMRRAKKILYQD